MLNKIIKNTKYIFHLKTAFNNLFLISLIIMVILSKNFINDPSDSSIKYINNQFKNATIKDNSNFINYIDNQVNKSLKSYEQINAETFINKNPNFDITSFSQINNYLFFKKDESYIVKDKATNSFQYISELKYEDTYPDYNDITNSKFKNYYVFKSEKGNIGVWQFQEDNTKTAIIYDFENKTINKLYFSSIFDSFINKYLGIINYFFNSFIFFLFVGLLSSLSNHNKRFRAFAFRKNKFKKHVSKKSINVEKINQEVKEEIIIKINK